MTWRDGIRKVIVNGIEYVGASFRGVPFFVESVEDSGGRRVVVHEFPLRDDPFVEDLGDGSQGFRFDGYVIGDDYLAQRDQLIEACRKAGPGELVHPYRGVFTAVCVRWAIRNARTDGGMAAVVLEFTEAPTQPVLPNEVVDSVEQVSAGADAAAAATAAEFVKQFDPAGMPAFALSSAEDASARAHAAMAEALAPIVSTTQELAAFNGRIALLTAQTASLVRQPAGVVTAFLETVAGLAETIAAAPGAVMEAFLDAYVGDLGPTVVATTSTRARELANQTAITAAIRRVFAVEAARLAPRVPYASIEEAIAARDRVGEVLEEQAGGAEDTAYPALVELRSRVLRAVPGGSQFASVVTVTRRAPIPSLLLSYQLYGSVDREADIIARNRISHPGFVAGELKVLSDG